MDRWKTIIAIIGGLGTVGGGIVAVLVSLADSASARGLRPIERRVTILETKVDISLPSIDRKLDVLIEAMSQREWRDHRVIIPAPAAPGDMGAPR